MNEKDKNFQEVRVDLNRKKEFRCGGGAPIQSMLIMQDQTNIRTQNHDPMQERKLITQESQLQIKRRNMGYGPFDVLDMPQDMNGYLAAQVGKHVMAHFIAGSNNVFEVDGILQKVGRNYMVVKDIQNGDLITCDFYSVRFVRVYGNQ